VTALEGGEHMSCPYLEEVVMVYCRAYPVKKLIPRSQSLAGTRCLGDCFDRCPFFKEAMEAPEAIEPRHAPVPWTGSEENAA
jgi:hypothetical protein